MKAHNSSAASIALGAATFGENLGYRLDGDIATLNAEIVRCNPDAVQCDWRIQLWACAAPFAGGHIEGIKVAEIPVQDLRLMPTFVTGTTSANLPVDNRFHSMVMVLASRETGKFATIHDYVNYPLTQSFVLPRMLGTVGYRFDGSTVTIDVGAIENPRDVRNVSGSLSLELWALPQPYCGGDFDGTELAGVNIGTLNGQTTKCNVSHVLPLNPSVVGERYVVLMLREWTARGYVTRDYACFPQRVQFADAVRRDGIEIAAKKASSQSRTRKVLAKVLETTVPAAKTRAAKSFDSVQGDRAKQTSKKNRSESHKNAEVQIIASSVTKEEVLRSRGRGRKLLAKFTAVTQPRNSTRH